LNLIHYINYCRISKTTFSLLLHTASLVARTVQSDEENLEKVEVTKLCPLQLKLAVLVRQRPESRRGVAGAIEEASEPNPTQVLAVQ
jgi:hypothetical protein